MYVKDMLFSDSNDERRIGKKARKMMTYISISVDEDLQRTLSFFQKVNVVSLKYMAKEISVK